MSDNATAEDGVDARRRTTVDPVMDRETFRITESLQEYIEKQVKYGGFANKSEMIRQAIREHKETHGVPKYPEINDDNHD